MAQKTGMRLLGVVENMTSEVFGSGGGSRLAEELEVPLLGQVPLDAALRESSDEGVPLVVREPDSVSAQAISEIARAIDASRGRRLHQDAQARLGMDVAEARPRLAALGFSPGDVEVLAEHFLWSERTGRLGHGLSRIEWLETWESLEPRLARSALCPSRATNAGTATAPSAT